MRGHMRRTWMEGAASSALLWIIVSCTRICTGALHAGGGVDKLSTSVNCARAWRCGRSRIQIVNHPARARWRQVPSKGDRWLGLPRRKRANTPAESNRRPAVRTKPTASTRTVLGSPKGQSPHGWRGVADGSDWIGSTSPRDYLESVENRG
jgi:hypothetical protein